MRLTGHHRSNIGTVNWQCQCNRHIVKTVRWMMDISLLGSTWSITEQLKKCLTHIDTSDTRAMMSELVGKLLNIIENHGTQYFYLKLKWNYAKLDGCQLSVLCRKTQKTFLGRNVDHLNPVASIQIISPMRERQWMYLNKYSHLNSFYAIHLWMLPINTTRSIL